MPDTNYNDLIGNPVSANDVDEAVKRMIYGGSTSSAPKKTNASSVQQTAGQTQRKMQDDQIAAYYKRRETESAADAGKKGIPAHETPEKTDKTSLSAPLQKEAPETSAEVTGREDKPASQMQTPADLSGNQAVSSGLTEHPHSGRTSKEKEKIMTVSTSRSDMPTDFRVRKDEIKKTTAVRGIPKPLMSYLTALFAGMGFYKASMKDMVAAFIAASVDPDVYSMFLPCLSDLQKTMAQEYMKRHKSMTDEFMDTKKKMDLLDKKLDTIRMMGGWLIADKCGYGPETYPDPKSIVLNEESDRGMVSDLIVRADSQVKDVRQLISSAEGRPDGTR